MSETKKKKTLADFPVGTTVTFKPGGRSKGTITATVTGHADPFLVTKDADGGERKCRPGQVVD